MRLRRFRLLKIAAVLLAAALLAPVVWHFPAFRLWCMQDDEHRYHTDPPGPWRLAKPFFAPEKDPMVSPGPWHWESLLEETRKSVDESMAAFRENMRDFQKNLPKLDRPPAAKKKKQPSDAL